MKADFWFDPICPWAWITSRWILEVATVRDIEISWNLFSLGHLNRDRKESEKNHTSILNSWSCGRVLTGATQNLDNQQVLALYTAISSRIHLNQERISEDLFRSALSEVGLNPELALEMNNSNWDLKIIESHDRGIALVGADVGTPIISINGVGFFGPVISPAPVGEAAGKLWDGLKLAAAYPGFFELKRSRNVGPLFT